MQRLGGPADEDAGRRSEARTKAKLRSEATQ